MDIIYIGNIHLYHRDNAMMCLENGKHVVIEKPITLTAKDAKEVLDFARSKKLFVLENMWTRFFPITKLAKELVQKGTIGEIKMV